MFTVKVREERVPQSGLGPSEVNEVLFEATQVMQQGLDIIIDFEDGSQATYTSLAQPQQGYSGAIYVMNRFGATVAKYGLGGIEPNAFFRSKSDA